MSSQNTPLPLTTATPPPVRLLRATQTIPAASVAGLLGGTLTIPQVLAWPTGVSPSALQQCSIKVEAKTGNADVEIFYLNPAWVAAQAS